MATKTRVVTKETVAALFDAGKMVTCRWPGSGDIHIGIQRHMVDDAMAEWGKLDADDRRGRMESVLKAIKRATKKVKQRRASTRDTDELAADVALFLGHELLYADGERWLVKGPSGADIMKNI